jgi:hypothetical protein
VSRALPELNLRGTAASDDPIIAIRWVELPALAVLPLLLSACAGWSAREQGTGRPAVRQPTPQERARIVSSVNELWKYESDPPGNLRYSYGVRLRRPPLRPRVVRAQISQLDRRYASAVVELRDRNGRRRSAAVLVLAREKETSFGGWGPPLAGPALDFPLSCTLATPKAVRDLLCPSPWRVLGYPRPRIHAQTAYSQRIPSPDLHAVEWAKVTLPGGVCGSSRPIRQRRYRYGPAALVHTDVDHVWWNPVVVSSWSRPLFGDVDGDGRDEAALQVVCTNGGGMAAGQLAFAAVVFKAVGRSMRVLGILAPRQPLVPGTGHTPLNNVERIERGRVIVSEAWYGPHDGTCCSSGRARTIWAYRGGRLRPERTTVLQKPRTSPLHIQDVIVEPFGNGLERYDPTTVLVTPDLRFVVRVENFGHATERNVRITLRIAQRPSPIVRTKTIERIRPLARYASTAVFGNLGGLKLGTKTTMTIEIGDRGTNPTRYPVLFVRG